MADNFNLRSFLSENKLTKNAQLLREVSDYGFDDLMDAVDDLYAPGTPEHTELLRAVEEAIHNNEIDMSEFGDNPSAPSQAVERIAGEIGLDETTEDMYKEAYTPKSKLEQVIQQAWAEPDLEKAKQIVHDLIEPSKVKSKDTIIQTIKGINSKPKLDQYLANSLLKFEKLGLNETATTMTTKEKELVKMVQEALGMEGYGDDNVNLKRDRQGLPPQQGPTYSEGDEIAEEEMVEKEPLPKYESIEKLMQEIEHGTNKAMFAFGISGSAYYTGTTITNLVSNTGVVATDGAGAGTPRSGTAAAPYGTDTAIFGYGQNASTGAAISVTNLVTNVGVIGNDVTGVGTARYQLAATGYGTDKALFGYGYGPQSMTNKVSNTGVVATDTTGVGTARAGLGAAVYGYDKAIFGYGSAASLISNLVSNAGVVATDTVIVGTARNNIACTTFN